MFSSNLVTFQATADVRFPSVGACLAQMYSGVTWLLACKVDHLAVLTGDFLQRQRANIKLRRHSLPVRYVSHLFPASVLTQETVGGTVVD